MPVSPLRYGKSSSIFNLNQRNLLLSYQQLALRGLNHVYVHHYPNATNWISWSQSTKTHFYIVDVSSTLLRKLFLSHFLQSQIENISYISNHWDICNDGSDTKMWWFSILFPPSVITTSTTTNCLSVTRITMFWITTKIPSYYLLDNHVLNLFLFLVTYFVSYLFTTTFFPVVTSNKKC